MKCAYKDCNKNIPLSLQYECRCGLIYCRMHNHDHDCDYDYKSAFRKSLKNKLVKVEASKLDKIE